ncbi:unnamed protein product [Heterobilharzia americana]|nr:unnamed protein product [Heterobilharzia americana]
MPITAITHNSLSLTFKMPLGCSIILFSGYGNKQRNLLSDKTVKIGKGIQYLSKIEKEVNFNNHDCMTKYSLTYWISNNSQKQAITDVMEQVNRMKQGIEFKVEAKYWLHK